MAHASLYQCISKGLINIEVVGSEIEALTLVQVTPLTIYDMCKAVERGMVMSDVRLLEKSGGKSEGWKAV